MRASSITFLCDETGCRRRFTAITEGPVEAHLDVTDAGWHVKRPVASSWKHFCPEHNPWRTDA